jgi:hypothetical protein
MMQQQMAAYASNTISTELIQKTTSRHVDARGSIGLKPQASSTMIGVWGGSFLSNVSTADITDTHWYCPPQTLGLFFILNMST